MKDLDDVIKYLKDFHSKELANALALVRYKAAMWDKYTRENRIHQDIRQAVEVTEIVNSGGSELTIEEMWDWCAELEPDARRAFHDFPNKAMEIKPHTDTTGATYTGYDEEDVPGTARKGEN